LKIRDGSGEMRNFNRTRNSEQGNQKELRTKPGPLVIKNLLKGSHSNEFENAKSEWDLVEPISNDSADFVENCELCNHRNYKGNWLIQNRLTGSHLKVGSDCIKRFVILNGTSSQDDSRVFFENKEKEIEKELKVKTEYNSIIVNLLPTRSEANSFVKALLSLLESRGKRKSIESKEGVKEIITDICSVPHPSEKEIDSLYTLLNTPDKFVFQKDTRKYKEFKLLEGETWAKKGKVTGTTLSNSKAYKPDAKY
jgi:hypothetical protein